jgi:lambda family phage portal protein
LEPRQSHGIALNMIDAELLDHTYNRAAGPGKNEIRMGVEVNPEGRPVAYHFLQEAGPVWSGVASAVGKRKAVSADQILHIFIQERPGQTRGVSWLAPTGLRAKLLDGIEHAVQVGYKVAASKMGFLMPGVDYEGEDIDAADVPTDVAPGMLDILPKGVTFENFDPGYPNAEFDGFKKSVVREIAAGLGVSYPELGNDFGGVSYSAGQIGVHSDAALWADLQEFWIEEFEEPIFNEWLLLAMTTGALNLPVSKRWKFSPAKFQPPRRKHIDPLKTHNAQRVALGDMSRSPFDIAAENGADLEDIIAETRRAVDLLAAAGLPIPESWAAGKELSQIVNEAADA